ncbi:MAG: hypothetical protein V3U45_08395 [bacterium]
MCAHGDTVLVRLAFPNRHSWREEVPVDRCIAPVVQRLNDAGVRTLNSCCGHGRAPGSIFYEVP